MSAALVAFPRRRYGPPATDGDVDRVDAERPDELPEGRLVGAEGREAALRAHDEQRGSVEARGLNPRSCSGTRRREMVMA